MVNNEELDVWDVGSALWFALVTWVQFRHIDSYPPPHPELKEIYGVYILFALGSIPLLLTCSRKTYAALSLGLLTIMPLAYFSVLLDVVGKQGIEWMGAHVEQSIECFVQGIKGMGGVVDEGLKYIHF